MLAEPFVEQAIAQVETDFDIPTGTLSRDILARQGPPVDRVAALERLSALLLLDVRLRDTFTNLEAARSWLSAPNRYLGGEKPADLLRSGQIHRIEAALEALDSGVFV
jgi:hypothetical protein